MQSKLYCGPKRITFCLFSTNSRSWNYWSTMSINCSVGNKTRGKCAILEIFEPDSQKYYFSFMCWPTIIFFEIVVFKERSLNLVWLEKKPQRIEDHLLLLTLLYDSTYNFVLGNYNVFHVHLQYGSIDGYLEERKEITKNIPLMIV